MTMKSAVGVSWALGAVAALIIALGTPLLSEQKHESKFLQNDPSLYVALRKAPKKAAARLNPMEGDPDALAAGATLFALRCAECHGEMAEGGRKGPSLRVDPVLQATPGTLFWVLTNGVVRKGMPVWSKLPEPQRWQLVSYLKSLQPFEKAAR